MKRIVNFLVLTYCLIGLASAQQTSINLDSCQKWARENYPMIAQFDLINATRDYTVSNANTLYIPQINLMGIAGVVDGIPNLSMPSPTGAPTADADPFKLIGVINLNQTIWDGGMIMKQKRIAKANAEVEAGNVELNLYALKERVSNLYFGILLSQEQLKQINLQEEDLLQNLKTVQVSVENGAAYNSDIDELKVALLNLSQTRVQMDNTLKAYANMLSSMTAKKISPSVLVEEPNLDLTLNSTEIHRPELNLFEKRKNFYQAHNAGAGEVLPTLSLIGVGVFLTPGVDIMTSSINHLLMGGLSLSWKLGGTAYTFGNDRKRLKIEKERVDVEKESFLFNTKLQMTQVTEEIQKWNAMIVSDQEIVRLRTSLKQAA
ncbi:MAG: TolC family protein, partial [Bacteroidales bacterium]